MPAKRLSMRRIRELLRLKFGGGDTSDRAIARQLGVARSTVQDYLARIETAGLSWPLSEEVTDAVLEQRLFARAGFKAGVRRRIEPDWATLARELKRPGVTLMLLWEEYRTVHPDGYGYSRCCELFREYELRLSPTMRQHHVAGDKLFVDFSGKKIPILDPATGLTLGADDFIPGLLQRQLNLPPDVVSLRFSRLDGSQSSFNAQRLKQPQDLATDGLVNT
jgi:hypothetical protein